MTNPQQNNPLLQQSGLPQFSEIRPEHIEPALAATIEASRKSLNELLDSATQEGVGFSDSILPIEHLGDRLHQVWGPVSHLNSVVNTPELREAYNTCLPILARYQSELSQDQRLFSLYKSVESSLAEPESSEASVIRHALLEFHLGGIDLPADKQARFREIREEMTQLQARFEQNLLDSMAAWSHHVTDEALLSGLPDDVIETARQAARGETREGWVFGLDQPTYIAVMTHADSGVLRETFYEAWTTRASDMGPNAGKYDNTKHMERILELRYEVAGLVGYQTYADYALATRMAGSVSEVSNFLHDLATVSRPAALKEFQELEDFAGRSLLPWDIAYYSEKLRLERFSISDEELRPYFPLEHVMGGLFELVSELYNISLSENNDTDNWHKDVRFFDVFDADGSKIGGMFIDLYARRNKRAGAWMDECIVRKRNNGELQLPVAHLVCNFAPPLSGNGALLTHDDVVTLFHEFGHTLHHLLTRIEYPSIAGINGVPWDAVELPSQFMENFAWSPDVVRRISAHNQTGEPLPEELLAKLEASRVFQSGMQMVRQLEFALFDWYLHSEYGGNTTNAPNVCMDRVRQEVAVLMPPSYNRMGHGFAHIFSGGYAAGYYSYKWAEVLAADAFSAFADGNLLDREMAARFRAEILEIGGSRDIGEAFATFRGRPPSIDALLTQSGIKP